MAAKVLLFPQNHPHVSIRSNLWQEEQSVLQLLLALLPLRLTGQKGVVLFVFQEAVEEVFVLETLLLIHCLTNIQPNNTACFLILPFMTELYMCTVAASPWLRTSSSTSTCHIPTAWPREWTQELCWISQSTNSVPTQHWLQEDRTERVDR